MVTPMCPMRDNGPLTGARDGGCEGCRAAEAAGAAAEAC